MAQFAVRSLAEGGVGELPSVTLGMSWARGFCCVTVLPVTVLSI